MNFGRHKIHSPFSFPISFERREEISIHLLFFALSLSSLMCQMNASFLSLEAFEIYTANMYIYMMVCMQNCILEQFPYEIYIIYVKWRDVKVGKTVADYCWGLLFFFTFIVIQTTFFRNELSWLGSTSVALLRLWHWNWKWRFYVHEKGAASIIY